MVVVGASAGGVRALQDFCGGLPESLDAAVFIVLHISPGSVSSLPHILQRTTRLPVETAVDGGAIHPGHIFVAPPDHHLLVHRDSMVLARGPRENRHRPAVDPLFRSAVRAFGAGVIGVILSGTGDDGTAGAMAVKTAGGIVIVQEPDDADFPGMPQSVLTYLDKVNHRLPASAMGAVIGRLTGPMTGRAAATAPVDIEKTEDRSSGYTCPQCHGALWATENGPLLQFECRVGHVFSPESLRTQQEEEVEAALWAALRALEESAALDRRLSSTVRAGLGPLGQRYREEAEGKEAQASLLRRLLLEPRSAHDRPGV